MITGGSFDKPLPDGVGPGTLGVRGGLRRSGFEETSEALYLTSGFVYESAEAAEASFTGEVEHFVYSRYGNPTVAMFEERIRHGLDLYQRGYAPVLIFTGGYGNGARFAESQVARRYALKHGVPESAILIESSSRTTRQNLAQARTPMQQPRLHRVIVVSDPLHMSRALRLSHDLGIDALGSSTPSTRFRTVQTQWRFLLQEVYFFHRDLVARAA